MLDLNYFFLQHLLSVRQSLLLSRSRPLLTRKSPICVSIAGYVSLVLGLFHRLQIAERDIVHVAVQVVVFMHSSPAGVLCG